MLPSGSHPHSLATPPVTADWSHPHLTALGGGAWGHVTWSCAANTLLALSISTSQFKVSETTWRPHRNLVIWYFHSRRVNVVHVQRPKCPCGESAEGW